MLVEFSVANYRSFKEKVTFSMVAAKVVAKNKELDENNVFVIDRNPALLKSAAIYGANASGKSNLAQALGFMRGFMLNSSKETQSTEKIGVERFRLSTETDQAPSCFEIVFLMDEKRYRYGFEATREAVISEWLFYVPTVRETKLFERQLSDFNISKMYKAEGVAQRTRSNALFLSVSAQFNVEIADRILKWLEEKLKIICGLNTMFYQDYTARCLISGENKSEIIQLIKKLDLGFGGIEVEESEVTADTLPKGLPDEIKNFILKDGGAKSTSVQTIHRKFDSLGKFSASELFDLEEQESEGTKKIFALAGLLVDTLKHGKSLVVDEFDARVHPLINRAIVELFNSNETNPNNAQLIFMTHDTNLLSNKLLRRDQIWFTEKNRYGATALYSLVEYKENKKNKEYKTGVRNDASFESDYIKGRYGAIPYIGSLTHLIDNHD